jgi:glutaminyl-tRNA synthetase
VINLAFTNQCSESTYSSSFDRIITECPRFGRLSLSGTVLSKRKIIKLIEEGHVHDWDDPRLYTLIALRRRGVPPGALLAFVSELGVTKAPTTIDVNRFEQVVRKYLETTVPRLMLVLDPISVIIQDLPEDYIEMVRLPFSKDPAYGVRIQLLHEFPIP